MFEVSTSMPWSSRLDGLHPPLLDVDNATSGLPPVLLHQGFLIESQIVWSSLRPSLQAAGRRTAAISEHFLRTIDSAHALGHDPDIALAQTLSQAIDALDTDEVDIVAQGSGATPALVCAMNDSRVRKLILWRPYAADVAGDGSLHPAWAAPLSLTEAEASIGVACIHDEIDVLEPAKSLRRELAALRTPTLVIESEDSSLTSWLRTASPDNVTFAHDDHRYGRAGTRVVDHSIGFLGEPLKESV